VSEPVATPRAPEPVPTAPAVEKPPVAKPEPPRVAAPPPIPAPPPVRVFTPSQGVEVKAAPAVSKPKPPINWEQFMGAKLFAWIGGLALFLGVAFFVKYSFEHNLIPPEVRV